MARGKKNEQNNEGQHEDPRTDVNEELQAGAEGGAQVVTGDPEGGVETTAEKTGSIVKKKYAGRYKDHRDGLSKFIAEQCTVEGNFHYGKFFDICRANGVKEEQIDPYKDILDPEKKINGLAGRTRMTLRNRLAAIVRKNEGKIKDADGNDHDTDTAPITVRTPTMAKAEETSGEGVEASPQAEAEAA